MAADEGLGAAPPALRDILRFWFEELASEQWFRPSDALDERCRRRFAAAHGRAARGGLDEGRETPFGCVALCLLLDQIPRNVFRGTPRAFATDTLALAITRHAVARGFDLDASLGDAHRQFLYMPLMHSEDIADQRESLRLGGRISTGAFGEYARRHFEIVERFGRFPHRNAILGRDSTPEESAFLRQPGSSF